MRKRFSRSLSAQLLGGVLLSLLAAALAFALFGAVGQTILERTVYGQAFSDRMADRQFAALQKFVEQEAIAARSLHRLNAWCSRSSQVYLTIYINSVIGHESPMAGGGTLVEENFDISYEDPEREYALRLSDGTQARAFVYYYAGDAYYYGAMGLSALLAYLELMDRGKYDGEAQLRHFTQRSLEKCLQIKSMADKLFAYFLVYSSEWEAAELETADADSLFQQLWGEYAFSLENKGFSVRCAFGELRGTLRVNMALLRRAFDNLYANLLKYADPARPIEIAYGRADGQVRLTLRNHVSPQRDKRESTSIGLRTCRRVLRHHGGHFAAAEEDGIFQADVSLPLADR